MLDRRPHWSVFPHLFTFAADASGSSVDDDQGDDDDEEEDDEEEDEDAGKDEAALRAELKESRAALLASKGASTKAFAKRRELKGELARLNAALAAKGTPEGAEADADADARIAAARSEGATSADAKAIRSAARGFLSGAGVPKDDLADAIRLLDLDDLELEDDGSIEGLDELVSALKIRHSGLFGRPTNRRRRIGGPADDKGGSKLDTRTASQKQAAAVLGG